jgi:hypothetical protein
MTNAARPRLTESGAGSASKATLSIWPSQSLTTQDLWN